MKPIVMEPVARRDEDEALFARDEAGQLIRVDPATEADYAKEVTVTIDGHPVKLRKAYPTKDAQGNVIKDAEGRTIPRATTIFDAATRVGARTTGGKGPIPVLCHQEHLRPVAVCRVCVVQIIRNGKVERKLLPACQHRAEDKMEVHTMDSPDPKHGKRVRDAVKVLTEMLTADHLPADEPLAAETAALQRAPERGRLGRQALALVPVARDDDEGEERSRNELKALGQRMGVRQSRFAPNPTDRGRDDSSVMIAVDHNRCILCDRCVRACDEVKENVVIGRTGKGYTTHIGFDLNDPMGQSSCVSCGECMVSCPTGALTFREFVRPEPWKTVEAPRPVTAEELKRHPLFSGVSYAFLKWNEGSAVRRAVKPGEVLCREGEFGSTAFLIESGRYDVSLRTPVSDTRKDKAPGLLGFLGHAVTRLAGTRTTGGPTARLIPTEGGPPLPLTGRAVAVVTPQDIILGEMACMGNHPRAATVTALENGEVIEILRNVVYMLQRNRASREMLDRAYRDRTLGGHLFNVALFAELDEAERKQCVAFLKEKVELVRVDPGQVIFLQGEPADNFFLVRQGFVKVAQKFYTQERVLNYLGPGSHFGEIGLLSAMSDLIARQVPAGLKPGVRTATCSALDHVELVRVRGDHFRQLLDAFPALREQVTAVALRVLEQNARAQADTERPLGDFLQQGLFGAQSLLVLDLNKCTRCDECTKACADTHQGVTRLIREGLRFENYLVATSCRSCLDPYCMVGCPVGSIRREGSLEIRIESWCIGCGLCAENCPYGNINMVQFPGERADPNQPGQKAKVTKATTCDLCKDIAPGGTDPSCVYACPHDAAFRMSGPQLLAAVDKAAGEG